MEENRKNLDWKSLVMVAMAVVLVLCFLKLRGLSNDIANLESMTGNYQSQINRLRGSIDSIYANVDEKLKEEASLLSSVDYTLGELDIGTNTIPMTLKIVPKHITEDMGLSVRVGDGTAQFSRIGNAFTATIPVSMFIGYDQYPILSIEASDGIRTERLEDVNITYLHYSYLPTIYVDIAPFEEYTKGKLELDSMIHLDCDSPALEQAVTPVKFELVTELNGKEIAQQDITSKVENGSYDGSFTASYAVSPGDTLCIYAVTEDSLGYIHKSLAYYWQGSDNGSTQSAITMDGSEYIYDKDGNLLNGG